MVYPPRPVTAPSTAPRAALVTGGCGFLGRALVDALAEYLQSPEPALHLTPVSITIDRLGVVRDDLTQDAHTLNFPELTARDRRLHLAMLAKISRDEALEAVEMVRDQQHRFMLI